MLLWLWSFMLEEEEQLEEEDYPIWLCLLPPLDTNIPVKSLILETRGRTERLSVKCLRIPLFKTGSQGHCLWGIWKHTDVHRYTQTSIHRFMHTETHRDSYTHRHIHTYPDMHGHTHIDIHTDKHMYTDTWPIHIHTHTETYTHMQIHTHRNTHVHTYTLRHVHTHECAHAHRNTHRHTVTWLVRRCQCTDAPQKEIFCLWTIILQMMSDWEPCYIFWNKDTNGSSFQYLCGRAIDAISTVKLYCSFNIWIYCVS